MIGFYDYTVIMTYISVVSSMIGIFCAVTDHISAAVCCLAFSGLCDMFDGKIARTKKNRTEEDISKHIKLAKLRRNTLLIAITYIQINLVSSLMNATRKEQIYFWDGLKTFFRQY